MRAVVTNPEIDIVVEVIGGTTVAKDAILAAIDHGKHIVTANKALLALHGNEIFAAAREQNVMVAFEGAVSGCIPIDQASCAKGSPPTASSGSPASSTARATSSSRRCAPRACRSTPSSPRRSALGMRKRIRPSTSRASTPAHKITLLSAIGFGIPVQFDRAYVEGITKLTDKDITYAEELGYRIKLLGMTRARARAGSSCASTRR